MAQVGIKSAKKIVCVSDLHIPYTSQYFIPFADYISKADKVVFCGDILDLVRCNIKDIKNSYIGQELLKALKKIIKATQTVFIEGNHDPELGKSLTELLGMEIQSFPFYRIGRMGFVHGYQFDPLCKHWDWKLLSKFAPWFFNPPSKWKQRNREKWHEKIGQIYAEAFSFLEKADWCRIMIVGHTHYPSIHKLETGQQLGDCGDWVDSRSWLEIERGKVEIKTL